MNRFQSRARRASMPFLALFFLAGCAVRVGDFTVLSTKNFNVGAKYKKTGRFVGEDIGFSFIKVANLKTAADNAIEEGKGVYLSDVVLEYVTKFPTVTGYRITGDVWAPVRVGQVLPDGEKAYELARTGEGMFLHCEGDTISLGAFGSVAPGAAGSGK